MARDVHEDRLPLHRATSVKRSSPYLKKGRQKGTVHREVFLRTIAPIGPLGAKRDLGHRAPWLREAGVPVIGAHRLRPHPRLPAGQLRESRCQRSPRSSATAPSQLPRKYARVDIQGFSSSCGAAVGQESEEE